MSLNNRIVGGKLQAGRNLRPGQSLISEKGSTVLSMQGDGNLVLYHNNKAIWATNTFIANSSMAFQGDGNLVVYSPTGGVLWATNVGGGTVLAVQDDSNLVVYNGNIVRWSRV